MTTVLRQGDVGLIPLKSAPTLDANHILKAEKRKLIRKGENGGVHELETLKTATIYQEVRGDVDLPSQLFGRYIEVKETTKIVHKEHAPLTLQPGWYEIRIQRESFAGIRRQVMD